MHTKVLDLEDLLAIRCPRNVARILGGALERPLGFDKLNQLYNDISSGIESECSLEETVIAARSALQHLGVSLKLIGSLNSLPQGPVVVVANHPFGGVEAVALVEILSRSGRDFKIMANSMLKIFPIFAPALIYVDPFGDRNSVAENLNSVRHARDYLRRGGMVGVFPAGSVATFNLASFQPSEDPWSPSIAKLILGARATVIPIYFHGRNSPLFQAVSLFSRTARLALLVRELVEKSPKTLVSVVGEPITPEHYGSIQNATDFSAWMRQKCLRLADQITTHY